MLNWAIDTRAVRIPMLQVVEGEDAVVYLVVEDLDGHKSLAHQFTISAGIHNSQPFVLYITGIPIDWSGNFAKKVNVYIYAPLFGFITQPRYYYIGSVDRFNGWWGIFIGPQVIQEVSAGDVIIDPKSKWIHYGSGIRWSEPYTTQFIKIDSFAEVRSEDGDEIMGLHSLYGNIIILKENSIHRYTVQGEDPPISRVDEIAPDIGCIAPNASLMVDNILYFVSWRGIYRYNNNVLQKIDNKIAEEIRWILLHLRELGEEYYRHISVGYDPVNNELRVWFPRLPYVNANNVIGGFYIEDIQLSGTVWRVDVIIFPFQATPTLALTQEFGNPDPTLPYFDTDGFVLKDLRGNFWRVQAQNGQLVVNPCPTCSGSIDIYMQATMASFGNLIVDAPPVIVRLSVTSAGTLRLSKVIKNIYDRGLWAPSGCIYVYKIDLDEWTKFDYYFSGISIENFYHSGSGFLQYLTHYGWLLAGEIRTLFTTPFPGFGYEPHVWVTNIYEQPQDDVMIFSNLPQIFTSVYSTNLMIPRVSYHLYGISQQILNYILVSRAESMNALTLRKAVRRLRFYLSSDNNVPPINFNIYYYGDRNQAGSLIPSEAFVESYDFNTPISQMGTRMLEIIPSTSVEDLLRFPQSRGGLNIKHHISAIQWEMILNGAASEFYGYRLDIREDRIMA